MSGSSTPSTHEIGIYKGVTLDLYGTDATWRWIIKDHASVAEYSQRLGDLVRKDRSNPPYYSRSRVEAGGRVTESALRAIIGVIPASPDENDDDRPVLTADGTVDRGFARLLELAIACWEYNCSIHEEFTKFANEVQMKWKIECPAEFREGIPSLQHQSPVDWMFISLVFEWHDVFTAMFARAIIKYNPKGFPVQGDKKLPEDFRKLVNETRKQKVRKTYNYVRDTWMSLYDTEHLHGPSMNRILLNFQDPKLNINLRNPAPEDLHERIDPDKLLSEYEKVVGENDEHVELALHPLPEAESAKGLPRRGGRGGSAAFSSRARNMLHSGIEVSKKVVKNGAASISPSTSQGSEHDGVWRETQSKLEANANNWRSKNLAGIPLSNSKFSELRSKHIFLRIPEIDSGSRRR